MRWPKALDSLVLDLYVIRRSQKNAYFAKKTYHHDSCQAKGTSLVDNVGIGCDWCDQRHSCHYGDIDNGRYFAAIDGKIPENEF